MFRVVYFEHFDIIVVGVVGVGVGVVVVVVVAATAAAATTFVVVFGLLGLLLGALFLFLAGFLLSPCSIFCLHHMLLLLLLCLST